MNELVNVGIIIILINLAIIFRRIGKLEIPVWTAFLMIAVCLVILGPYSYDHAVSALSDNADVFVFLFGMFVIVAGLDLSGVLDDYAKFLMNKTSSWRGILFIIHFVFGLAASVLINDTVAILGPVILLSYCKFGEVNPKPYVISLAFALTFGSALLPIGNPQNYILATRGSIPFTVFLLMCFIPTVAALVTSYYFLFFTFRNDFKNIEKRVVLPLEINPYNSMHKTSRIALVLLIIGLVSSDFLPISTTEIILLIVAFFLFLTNERDQVLAKIDWGVLLLFAGLFIVIDYIIKVPSVSDFLATLLNSFEPNFEGFLLFILLLVIISQVISNVPAAIIVAQVLPGTPLDLPIFWITAALTTTFAGSTSVLGAASNIIVIEISKKRGLDITWWEFTKIGLPLSVIVLIELILFGLVWFALPL